MQIYQFLNTWGNNSILQALSKKGEIILGRIAKKKDTSKWKAPYLTFYLERDRNDLMIYPEDELPIVSQRTWNALKNDFGLDLRTLPVKIYLEPDLNYYALDVLTVVDCLDKDRSGIEENEEGHIYVNNPVLNESKIDQSPIFKTYTGLQSPVFVNDVFKKVIEDNELTGFQFSKVDFS